MLRTSFAGIELENCVYNASGARCTSTDELLALERSQSGAVLTKSCTLALRQGNPEPRYYGFRTVDKSFSINSMGIPNFGIDYYLTYAQTRQNTSKPYVLSISGLSVDENVELLQKVRYFDATRLQAIELNVSCPNIVGKPQLGYDPDGLNDFLDVISFWDGVPLGLKLPPYFDFAQFEQTADIIRRHKFVRYIVCCNSFGNGLFINSETETVVIKPKNGFGGIGGTYLKPIALANVRKFYELLSGDGVDIIGCGGVTCGADVFDMILVGAKAVQIGTELMETGVNVFEKCLEGLTIVMQRKGYTSIEDFYGKLKTLETLGTSQPAQTPAQTSTLIKYKGETIIVDSDERQYFSDSAAVVDGVEYKKSYGFILQNNARVLHGSYTVYATHSTDQCYNDFFNFGSREGSRVLNGTVYDTVDMNMPFNIFPTHLLKNE